MDSVEQNVAKLEADWAAARLAFGAKEEESASHGPTQLLLQAMPRGGQAPVQGHKPLWNIGILDFESYRKGLGHP